MRTCVRMGPRPWKPEVELHGALQRGELDQALLLAAEVREARHGRPLDVDEALEFLPVVARASPREYDTWAMRWLTRWCAQTPGASIDHAAEVAGLLADLRLEPAAIESLRGLLSGAASA